MAGSLHSAGRGAYEAGTREGGATWQDAVAIGGGLLGARASLGGLAQAGAADRLGRTYLGAEKMFLTGTAAGRGLSVAGRASGAVAERVIGAVGKAAFHTVNAPLSLAVHSGLKRISTRAHDVVSDSLNRVGFKVCFAANTPLRTPQGWQWIELFRRGDLVLSRDENDPTGPLVAKMVEEVFVREGLIWHLHVGGQVIRTTAEHPFFVEGRGWVACHELKVGDRLLDEDGGWVPVKDLLDTGEWETVYNLRVADFHTYFVGSKEWGFSVWAHNADCIKVVTEATGETTLKLMNKFAPGTKEARQLQRFVRAWNGAIDETAGAGLTTRSLSASEQHQSKIWKQRMRRSEPERFQDAGKVVGHVPDAAAGGPVVPPNNKAMALWPEVNSYVGGAMNGVPTGTTYHRVKLVRSL